MKAFHFLSTLALATTLTACGNDGWLSSLNGANDGDLTSQEQAIEDLAGAYCTTCNAPDGGAEHVFADVTPEEYAGGVLELALIVGSPTGVVDTAGNWTVSVLFRINDFDLFAALPQEAWLFSGDRTEARVVLISHDGLPPGHYVVKGAIDLDGFESDPAFLPGGYADDMETYEVPGEHEGDTGEHEGDTGEHGGQDGEGDHTGGDGEPDSTPTPEGEPDPA